MCTIVQQLLKNGHMGRVKQAICVHKVDEVGLNALNIRLHCLETFQQLLLPEIR
jgi:hypothetical protein